MCGRFTLTYREKQRLADELGVTVEELEASGYVERYNIAPTDSHPIVRVRYEDRELLPAKWGLVNSWAKDAKRAAAQINARSETLDRSSAFRDAFRRRRCVVPADGYFEWTGLGPARQPYWFHRADGGLLLFAGLYESWQPEPGPQPGQRQPGQRQRTFTIVTTAPNAVVATIHDRMPVILPESAVNDWLDPRQEDVETLKRLFVPPPEDLLVPVAVSQRVNSVKNDDPACLNPVEVAPRLL